MQRESEQPDIPQRRRSEWSRLRRTGRETTRLRPHLPGDLADQTATQSMRAALPVTARQAAAVCESLAERHQEARCSDAEVLAQQTEDALRGMEPYVDHGGGLSDGLVELLGQLGIVIVPLAEADAGARLDAIA